MKKWIKLESKQRVAYSATAVKCARSVVSRTDLYLEDDVAAYIKERHPEFRTSGQVIEYTRHAAVALSSQRDLTSQEKLELRESCRSSVQSHVALP